MESSNSSNSSKGEGNTKPPPFKNKKQVSPAKGWCFTLNNYTSEEVSLLSSIVPQECDKYILAYEVGEEGTPHIQGWINFITKKRPMSVFKQIPRIHWEKSKGNIKQQADYCSKEGKVFLVKGMPRPLKRLACEDNLYNWQREICAICEQEPDDRTIYWYWSEAGNVGKTTFGKYLHRKYGAIVLGGKSADMKNGIVEYHKLNGFTPELIVVNIPRSFNEDYISYTGIEECKDMFFYSGKYEGSMVDGNSPHIIIFANHFPKRDMISKDRWKIKKLDNMD